MALSITSFVEMLISGIWPLCEGGELQNSSFPLWEGRSTPVCWLLSTQCHTMQSVVFLDVSTCFFVSSAADVKFGQFGGLQDTTRLILICTWGNLDRTRSSPCWQQLMIGAAPIPSLLCQWQLLLCHGCIPSLFLTRLGWQASPSTGMTRSRAKPSSPLFGEAALMCISMGGAACALCNHSYLCANDARMPFCHLSWANHCVECTLCLKVQSLTSICRVLAGESPQLSCTPGSSRLEMLQPAIGFGCHFSFISISVDLRNRRVTNRNQNCTNVVHWRGVDENLGSFYC